MFTMVPNDKQKKRALKIRILLEKSLLFHVVFIQTNLKFWITLLDPIVCL